jgi:DNA polymerase-3 subunit beta
MTATMTRPKRAKANGVTVTRAALKAALDTVGDAVQAKGPKPILGYVLLSGGMLSATDLELRITTPLPGSDGLTVLLPFARLKAIVGNLHPTVEVTIAVDGSSAVVQASGGTWRLPVEDAAEFPSAGEFSGKRLPRLPGDQFAALVKTVKGATDNQSSRYALGGVQIEFSDGELTFIATDGRRLYAASADIDQALDDSQTLVTRRTMDVLQRLAVHADEIELQANTTDILATIGETTVQARLLEGKFPRWRDVDTSYDDPPSMVVVEHLMRACNAADVCTSEASRGVDFTFTQEGLFLAGRSSEYGESSATCELADVGKCTTVKLDPAFVADWLVTLDPAETIAIEAKDKQSAVVFRADRCRAVVMPLDPSA